MTSPSIPEQVSAALEASSLTIKEIAALAGVAERTIYFLKSGRPVHTTTLEKVAAVLGLEVRLLVAPKKERA